MEWFLEQQNQGNALLNANSVNIDVSSIRKGNLYTQVAYEEKRNHIAIPKNKTVTINLL